MSKVIKETEEVLDLICSGNFTGNDVVVFFNCLRSLDIKNKSIVWELGNFFSHLEGRDVGFSHGVIYDYIKNVIEVSASGGRIESKNVLSKDFIYEKIIDLLEKSNIEININKLNINKEKLFKLLFEKLDGVEFYFNKSINGKSLIHKDIIKKCFLKNGGNKMNFCFNLSLSSGHIRMDPGALWCSPLFN